MSKVTKIRPLIQLELGGAGQTDEENAAIREFIKEAEECGILSYEDALIYGQLLFGFPFPHQPIKD
jgi:glycerol-3-phosphate O-acyltransferase